MRVATRNCILHLTQVKRSPLSSVLTPDSPIIYLLGDASAVVCPITVEMLIHSASTAYICVNGTGAALRV